MSRTKGLSIVDSPWKVPLPHEEYITSRVVVYSYDDGWIPITFYSLVDAIKLHRMALSSGMDIVLFPPDLDPRISTILLTDAYCPTVPQAWSTQALTDKYSQYATRKIGQTVDLSG